MLRKFIFLWLVLGFMTTVYAAEPTALVSDTDVLTIWWNKGYYPEEDAAIQQAVTQWEQQTHHKVKLNLYAEEYLNTQIERSLKLGNLPDIMFAHSGDFNFYPRLAWEDKLVDVSDVLESAKDLYMPDALKATSFYNNVTKKRSYYGVPIEQQTIHLFYWRDLVEKAGFTTDQIPQEWDKFWAFWQQVQQKLRAQGQKDVYGLGFTLSPRASDTYFFFEQLLEIHNVVLLDDKGQLLLDNPKVKQDIINLLTWFTNLYKQGYVPTNTVNWTNQDNNVNFLNRSVVMTPNPTLSIPVSQRQDKELYLQKIVTMEFPKSPSGKPIRYFTAVKQAVIFNTSKNQKLAKEFLTYLIKPENLGNYVKGSGGRWIPVMLPHLQDPFWKETKDPHISVALRQLTQQSTRSFYPTFHPAYCKVQDENIWGNALKSILVDGLTAEQATGEAIGRIKQIFAEWK